MLPTGLQSLRSPLQTPCHGRYQTLTNLLGGGPSFSGENPTVAVDIGGDPWWKLTRPGQVDARSEAGMDACLSEQ